MSGGIGARVGGSQSSRSEREVATAVNVRELTENAALGAVHFRVLAVCFATAVVDGLDNQAIGFSAAAIAPDLGISLGSFGPIFAAGVVGGLVGAVGLGTLADRIGRRMALVICTHLFAVMTFATAFSTSVGELLLLRFLAGVGLGGAMPGFLTIASEYAPRSRRALATGLLWCGYPVGGVLGGIVGSYVIPRYGWKAMFQLGAILATLVAGFQWLSLPESLQYLTLKGGKEAKIRGIARRLAPMRNFDEAIFYIDAKANEVKTSFREIFANGRMVPTLMLWVVLFCTFMISNFFVVWSPPLLKSAGLSVSSAALMLSLWNLAGIPSQAGTGQLIDRMGPFRLLPLTYAALGLSLGLLGLFLHVVPMIAVLMMSSGFLLGPCITGMLFLATDLYPSAIRSTGVGWAVGVGRSGQVVGSLLIGWIVSAGVSVSNVISGMCVLPFIALTGVVVLGVKLRRRSASARLNHD